MNNWYEEDRKEQNKDFETSAERPFTLKLTDRQCNNLELMALKAGFKNSAELLSSFIGDLTKWQSNGRDESDLADKWYDRAFGINVEYRSFFRYHCYNYDYNVDDLIDALHDEDIFEEIYQEYLNESSYVEEKRLDSKDGCRKILEELTAAERAKREALNNEVKNN